jgi:serine/threonine protein kinase
MIFSPSDLADLFIQHLDSQGDSPDPVERGKLIRSLFHLADATGEVPEGLFVQGVSLSESEGRKPLRLGAFSDFYRGSFRGQAVALRRLRLSEDDRERLLKVRLPLTQSSTRPLTPSYAQTFCKEALLWRHLHHPNVVPVLGVDKDTFASTGFVAAVSPWMERGNILQYSERNPSYDPKRDFLRLVRLFCSRHVIFPPGLNFLP